MSLQSLIDAAQPGATITLPAGVYAESITITKPLTLESAPEGTTLDGRVSLSGWQQDGEFWYAAYPYAFGNTSPTSSVTAQQAAGDQCWLGDTPLVHMSRAKLTRGGFAIDRTAKRIYLADDPAAGVMVSSLARAITVKATAAGTVLRGLTVIGYASPLQNGQIRIEADGVTLEHISSTYSAGGGISISDADNVTLRRCTFNDNGHNGYHAPRCNDLLFERCQIGRNNTKRINAWWEAGAGKTVRKARVSFRHCEFVDNHGDGPWWDISAQQALVIGCHIHGNKQVNGRGGKGIDFEESKGALFLNNLIEHCEGDGVYVNEANGAVIAFNTIRGCGTGVNVSEGNRTNPDSATDGVKWDAFDNHIQFNRFEGNRLDVYAGHWTGTASATTVLKTLNGNHYASGAKIRLADSGGTNRDYNGLAAMRAKYPQWEQNGTEGATAPAQALPEAWAHLLGVTTATAMSGAIVPPQGPYGADWQGVNAPPVEMPPVDAPTPPAPAVQRVAVVATSDRPLVLLPDTTLVVDAPGAGSVVFVAKRADGLEVRQVESHTPFALAGDTFGGNGTGGYVAHTLLPGVWSVEITPYSDKGGAGVVGAVQRVTVVV